MDNNQAPEKEVYRAPAFADFKPELSAPGGRHLKDWSI